MRSEASTAIGGLIESAAARLKASGVAKPRREAHRLWAWVTRAGPGEAFLARDRAADLEAARGFERAVARRVAGEPIAYVTGMAGFRRLELRSDRRALIPRPETEGVIEHALGLAPSGRALDLGTGTGCLALALAQEGRYHLVTAVDVSPAALQLARENAALTGHTLRFIRSDLGTALRGEAFDLLVANPPYLTDAEYDALDPAVREWEPRLALAAGPDGLALTRRILVEGRELLRDGGWLVMEVDSTRGGDAAGTAGALGWTDVRVHDDLFGRPRYLTARREHQS
ncbi:MAG TPA: peptide chain release factor N(5)-glutamine methyltransferase [Gemmatimonadales bacterium]|nr:peptide chain release factor N(5)-glutamine methyltransferase [Gemmatimonadales bacterium]